MKRFSFVVRYKSFTRIGQISTDRRSPMDCNCAPVCETRYEGDSDLLVTVVEALATVKGVDPLEMDPLYDVIDVEAVDRLLRSHDDSTGPMMVLRFRVDNWNVFIRGDGLIRVCDTDMSDVSAPVFEKAISD